MSIAVESLDEFASDPKREFKLDVVPEMRSMMDDLAWASSFSAEDFENHTGFFDRNDQSREQTLYDRAVEKMAQDRAVHESPVIGQATLRIVSQQS